MNNVSIKIPDNIKELNLKIKVNDDGNNIIEFGDFILIDKNENKNSTATTTKIDEFIPTRMTDIRDNGTPQTTMKLSPEDRVIKHLRRKNIRKFKKSELTSALKHIFCGKSNLVDDVLRQLTDNNYIRKLPSPPTSRKGGRPAEIYEVNHKVFET